jgi:hypothetical protein
MWQRFLEKIRGSSHSPDDLSVGTKRPGDFVEPDADGTEPIVPNPHDEDERPAQ